MAHPTATSTFAGSGNSGLQVGKNSGNITNNVYSVVGEWNGS